MQAPFTLHFSQGSTAVALLASNLIDVEASLRHLGFQQARPVIVVIGGASGLQDGHADQLRSLFCKAIAPAAEALHAIVIDGGTDAGIMRMMGAARHATQSTFPLLGILPIGLATLPDAEPPAAEAAPLEPHHTHFILVPGTAWGDESHWIAAIASILAQGAPTLTVLMNGGEITWKDAAESVKVGRRILAVAGSGRTADILVATLQGQITEERAHQLVASGLLQAISLDNEADLANALRQILVSPESRQLN